MDGCRREDTGRFRRFEYSFVSKDPESQGDGDGDGRLASISEERDVAVEWTDVLQGGLA
jgi:hypothetical protein